jgi:hypothetical protein
VIVEDAAKQKAWLMQQNSFAGLSAPRLAETK